jgi:hypothetical protein
MRLIIEVRGSGSTAPPVSISALDGGECSSVQLHDLAALTLGKSSHCYWLGGWISLSAGVRAMDRRNVYCPYTGSNPGLPAHCSSL